MKVLDLQCPQGHSFEGWFGSEDDFQSQHARQLVQCPVCGDSAVTKKLSAPRLNFGAAKPADPPAAKEANAAASPTGSPATDSAGDVVLPAAMQRAWLETMRRVVEQTEDVGAGFTEEARRIHYGEVPERGIRGQATPEQAQALKEEGIDVMALPLPQSLKGPVQ